MTDTSKATRLTPVQQRIIQQLQSQTINKGELLLSPGETCRKVWYVKSGLLRAYYIAHRGRQHTTWLMGKYDVMISIYSFFTQRPAQEYIEALQDSVLQSLTWAQLQSYYADFREGNLVGRILTERYYMQSEERALFLRTRSPEERYLALLEKHPDIDQQATTEVIASYLGVTRETYSKTRSQHLRRQQQASSIHPKNIQHI